MAKTPSGRVVKAFEDKSLWKHNTLWTSSYYWNRYQDIWYFKEKCQDIIFSITLVVTIFVRSLFFLVTDDVRRFPRRRENGKRRKQSYLMSILPPGTECLEYFRLNPGNWNRGNSGWIKWILESPPFIFSGSRRGKIDTVHIYRFDLSTGTLQANFIIYKNTE